MPAFSKLYRQRFLGRSVGNLVYILGEGVVGWSLALTRLWRTRAGA